MVVVSRFYCFTKLTVVIVVDTFIEFIECNLINNAIWYTPFPRFEKLSIQSFVLHLFFLVGGSTIFEIFICSVANAENKLLVVMRTDPETKESSLTTSDLVFYLTSNHFC